MKSVQYQDQMAKLFYEPDKKYRVVTFQVCDYCNLQCTYCYEINKSNHTMSFDVAKRFIDLLLADKTEYVSTKNTAGLIIEFIGGEPLLEVELISKITDYFIHEMIRLEHPWATRYKISICSNGVLYFDPKWQEYMKRHGRHLSFSISVDGCKELHDACRIFPDGSGSYDLAMAGVRHYVDVLGGEMGSKMTLAPSNIQYTYKAVKELIENGYEDINLNCVYESGWDTSHALILYNELKKVSDYMLENGYEDKVDLSMFEQRFFRPKKENDNNNWCFVKGTQIETAFGYKPIEELKKGAVIWTLNNELHEVDDLTYRNDWVYELTGNGFIPTTVTGEHPFLTPKGWVNAKDLKHKDKIALSIHKFGMEKAEDEAIEEIARGLTDTIPIAVYTWTEECVRKFLEVLIADRKGEKDVVTIDVPNAKMCNDLLLFMRSCGYIPRVDKKRSGYKISTETEAKDEIDKTLNVLWTDVYDIGLKEYTSVYNLKVRDNHTFIANGIVVHNCGGDGSMIACDWKGDVYPCIRYMESSLGEDQAPLKIGDVYNGIMQTECDKECVECLRKITRRSQSTDECFYCPIAEGCSWCSAFNYQEFGTADKRATYICVMHKARALANAYHWNRLFRKQGVNKRMKLYIPEDWALEIIDKDEWDMLKHLEGAE